MTLIRIALSRSDASGVDVPAKGYLHWRPSKRRHVEDPDDHIVLPTTFAVRLGDDFLDEDGVIVTPGEPGIAWCEVDPTEVPDWAWTVVERTDYGRGTTYVEVPDQALIEYADLIVLDPDTLDPEVEPEAAWDVELESRVPNDGTDGYVLSKGTPDNIWITSAAGSLPAGGSTGEVLTKLSGVDGDADWETVSGGGSVESVNGDTGPAVVLDADDIEDTSTTNKYVTAADVTKLGNLSGTNTGDQDLSGLAVKSANLSDLGSASTARTNLGLGTAATTAASAYATSAQGVTADSAVQPGDLAAVATSGDYDDLTDKPTALPPNGGAGGVLSGTYPAPGFAVDMAEQSELDAHTSNTSNPHAVTKAQVGLGNVDNTSDVDKPISDDTQDALDLKRDDSMATNKLLGRGTAGTGAIEEITLGTNLSLTGTTLNATDAAVGDVVGPGSAADNAVTRYDGTTGKLVQNSAVTVDDSGNIATAGTVDGRDVSTDGTKLDGITSGATANSTDAQLRDRSTHTGTQTASTISDLSTAAYVPGGTDVPVTDGGTGRSTGSSAYGIIAAGITAAGAQQTITPGTSGNFLKSAGASALASFASIQESDVTSLVSDLAGKEPTITAGTTAQYLRGDKSLATFNTDVRTNRLDQMSAPTADLSINTHKLTNVTDGTAAQDASTKAQLDAAVLAYKRVRPNTVAILGASIAAMAGGTGVGIYDTPAASPLTRTDGYFPWANASLGGRLTLVKNAGVSGDTSAQILARITDVTNLAVLPGYCILSDAASNDLLAGTASATIISNLLTICNALQAKGITVVICTVLPIAGTTAHVQRQEEVNRWIRDRAGQPGFIVCDWAARWGDPTTVGPKTGFSTDGLHPTPIGAGAIGKVLADALRPHLGGSILLASHNLDQLTVNLNPMMVGTGGTASTGTSGSVADNWITFRGSGAGTLAAAKVARTDGIGGSWQQLTLSGSASSYFLYSDVASAGISGDKWQAEMEFEAADFSGVTDFRVVVEALTSGQSGLGLYQLSATALPTDITSGVVRSPVFTVPASGPFGLRTMLYMQGTTGSVKVSRFSSRKVA